MLDTSSMTHNPLSLPPNSSQLPNSPHTLGTGIRSTNVFLDDHFEPTEAIILISHSGKILNVHLPTELDPTQLCNIYHDYAIQDYGNLFVFPGLIDANVHLHTDFNSEWQSIEYATELAAKGGVTFLVDNPVMARSFQDGDDYIKALKKTINTLKNESRVDFGVMGILEPRTQDSVARMREIGVLGVKCFLMSHMQEGIGHYDSDNFQDLVEEMEKHEELLMVVHPELATERELYQSSPCRGSSLDKRLDLSYTIKSLEFGGAANKGSYLDELCKKAGADDDEEDECPTATMDTPTKLKNKVKKTKEQNEINDLVHFELLSYNYDNEDKRKNEDAVSEDSDNQGEQKEVNGLETCNEDMEEEDSGTVRKPRVTRLKSGNSGGKASRNNSDNSENYGEELVQEIDEKKATKNQDVDKLVLVEGSSDESKAKAVPEVFRKFGGDSDLGGRTLVKRSIFSRFSREDMTAKGSEDEVKDDAVNSLDNIGSDANAGESTGNNTYVDNNITGENIKSPHKISMKGSLECLIEKQHMDTHIIFQDTPLNSTIQRAPLGVLKLGQAPLKIAPEEKKSLTQTRNYLKFLTECEVKDKEEKQEIFAHGSLNSDESKENISCRESLELKRRIVTDSPIIHLSDYNTEEKVSPTLSSKPMTPASSSLLQRRMLRKSSGLVLQGMSGLSATSTLSSPSSDFTKVNSLEVVKSPSKVAKKEAKYNQNYRIFLANRPQNWEENAVSLVLSTLDNHTKLRVFLPNLSLASSFLKLREKKKINAHLATRIFGDVSPAHLFFSEKMVMKGETKYKVSPPFRNKENRKLLVENLRLGGIDLLSSFQFFVPPRYKQIDDGNFRRAFGGLDSMGCSLQAAWTAAYSHQQRTNKRFTEDLMYQRRIVNHILFQLYLGMCTNPAKMLRVSDRKGSIKKGCDADFVVWDPYKSISNNNLAPNHVFAGKTMLGLIHKTILRGRIIYDKEDEEVRNGYEVEFVKV